MPVPDFQTVMLPILKVFGDRQEHTLVECVDNIEKFFNLTEEEKAERVPSGKQRKIYNRITWAITHMQKARLLDYIRRGVIAITDRGMEVLSQNPTALNTKMLRAYPEYLNFIGRSVNSSEGTSEQEETSPEEIIGALSEQLTLQLADDIIDLISKNSPAFFEQLVMDLLLKMGYGGFADAGEVTGRSGDGGIDGIIKQDMLGLDTIYVQAKKWDRDTSIGRPEIQKFAGALLGKGANKGIFIATCSFSVNAIDYAKSVPNAKIILIDGITLAKFMIKYDLGVSISNIVQIKKIDSDYFETF